MDFKNEDPGATRYGNFINYYTFNSADDRLALLPTHIWSQLPAGGPADDKTTHNTDYFLALDIGCNAGNLTQLLYGFLTKHTNKTVVIVGIDIDAVLIDRANEHNQHTDNVFYNCTNIMDSSSSHVFQEYFTKFRKSKFDSVFCFSLTMWIHLNNGDVRLKQFLTKVASLARVAVVEPQPWKCYVTAVKRMRRANETFTEFTKLTWRQSIESDIDRYLIDDCALTKIFETIPTKWNRKIVFYRS